MRRFRRGSQTPFGRRATISPFADQRVDRSALARFEIVIVALIAIVSAAWSSHVQDYQIFRFWDSDEYFLMAEQFGDGRTVTAAAPYSYRVLVPWVVGVCCRADIQRGFLLINLATGIALVVMLVVWLRRFVSSPGIRVTVATACALQWITPLRLVFFYPAYVDPLFQLALLAALIVGDRLLARLSIADGVAFVGLVTIGTLARETMLILPLAAVIAVVLRREAASWRRLPWELVALGAGVAAYLVARSLVDPRPGYRFLDAIALHLGNKPIESLLLTWFLTFGPLMAVVAYDWRATWRFLSGRPDLAMALVAFVGLAYVGGHDTERYLFWAMPLVYLLMALSLQRHRALVVSRPVLATFIAGQLLASRIFWGIPDPADTMVALSDTHGVGALLYAVANRVFVIDDFYGNLWSNFGSRPFHLVQLAFYLTVSVVVIALMRRRDAALPSVPA